MSRTLLFAASLAVAGGLSACVDTMGTEMGDVVSPTRVTPAAMQRCQASITPAEHQVIRRRAQQGRSGVNSSSLQLAITNETIRLCREKGLI